MKIFFIPCQTRTYGKNAVYIFVDFRIKSAGTSNYGGAPFSAPAEKGNLELKIENGELKARIKIKQKTAVRKVEIGLIKSKQDHLRTLRLKF